MVFSVLQKWLHGYPLLSLYLAAGVAVTKGAILQLPRMTVLNNATSGLSAAYCTGNQERWACCGTSFRHLQSRALNVVDREMDCTWSSSYGQKRS